MSKGAFKKAMARCRVVAIPTKRIKDGKKVIQLYRFRKVNQKAI